MKLTKKDTDRFWSKVDKTDTCWLWTGTLLKNQYGVVSINYRTLLAHRVAWLSLGNFLEDGHVLHHKCDNKHCVNPEHLEALSNGDHTFFHKTGAKIFPRDG